MIEEVEITGPGNTVSDTPDLFMAAGQEFARCASAE